MTKKFAPSEEVLHAIRDLFGDEDVGLGFLEIHDEESIPERGNSEITRATSLRNTLENYIVNMAAELRELGEAEEERLQAEARATLVALRELFSSFPEVARER